MPLLKMTGGMKMNIKTDTNLRDKLIKQIRKLPSWRTPKECGHPEYLSDMDRHTAVGCSR
jgi:hypothetical protein